MWSDELQQKTRMALSDPILAETCLKCLGLPRRFGYIKMEDAISERWKVYLRDSNDLETYASLDELIQAGWAVD